jgi:hypothetical protein
MTPAHQPSVVLALAPVYRGVGFIVFDRARAPLDWGVKETRRDKQTMCRERVSALLSLYRPGVVILEQTGGPFCRRRRRIRDLISDLAALAEDHGSSVARYERAAIAACLRLERGASKDAIAAAVAEALPVLSHRLPRSRRVWESEKHSMALFEATGLALAHFSALDEVDAR